MDGVTKPQQRIAYGVNPEIVGDNQFDPKGNPSGGEVLLTVPTSPSTAHVVLKIEWQDGPLQTVDENTNQKIRNGAFIEDVLWAALQRLEFLNEGKFKCRQNSIAITKIEEALWALNDRTNERSYRGVEGTHEV